MGEQAAKIGKKLEGFGVNFFANLGWTELTQDKEIKCTRSSHKKKTHGIDLLCKFTNPYIVEIKELLWNAKIVKWAQSREQLLKSG